MRSISFALYLTGLFIAIFSCSLLARQEHSLSTQVDRPPFPFKVLDQVITGNDYPVSKAKIFLEPQYYSKNNIEHIFKWYSQEHNRKNELISIFLFTNMDNLIAERDFEIAETNKILKILKPDAVITQTSGKVVHRKAALYDAYFRRTVDYSNGANEVNERYTYSPDLNNPAITKTIILKGRDPFEAKP